MATNHHRHSSPPLNFSNQPHLPPYGVDGADVGAQARSPEMF